jgi:hypothetical protein
MVLSSSYRMSSQRNPAAEEIDGGNRMWHRAPLKRLQAEAVRDALLTVSGRLNPKLYGPSVALYLTPFMKGRGKPDQSGPLDGDGRRSIYLSVRRTFLPPMLKAFDFPAPANSPFVAEQASLWADRILDDLTPDAPGGEPQVRRMYLQALGRSPHPEEVRAALAFVAQQQQGYREAESGEGVRRKAWTDLCHVLMNVKEFIYLP